MKAVSKAKEAASAITSRIKDFKPGPKAEPKKVKTDTISLAEKLADRKEALEKSSQ